MLRCLAIVIVSLGCLYVNAAENRDILFLIDRCALAKDSGKSEDVPNLSWVTSRGCDYWRGRVGADNLKIVQDIFKADHSLTEAQKAKQHELLSKGEAIFSAGAAPPAADPQLVAAATPPEGPATPETPAAPASGEELGFVESGKGTVVAASASDKQDLDAQRRHHHRHHRGGAHRRRGSRFEQDAQEAEERGASRVSGRGASFSRTRSASRSTNANANGWEGDKWPLATVPYAMAATSESYQASGRTQTINPLGPVGHARIAQGLLAWRKQTCLDFELTRADVDMSNLGSGLLLFSGAQTVDPWCASEHGAYPGLGKKHAIWLLEPKQTTSFPDGCSDGIVMHEVGHACGLTHTQRRPDRDDWFIVKNAYLTDGQYTKLTDSAMQSTIPGATPMDQATQIYGSIMCYPKDGEDYKPNAAKWGHPDAAGEVTAPDEVAALKTFVDRSTTGMGQDQRLNDLDTKSIREYYDCDHQLLVLLDDGTTRDDGPYFHTGQTVGQLLRQVHRWLVDTLGKQLDPDQLTLWDEDGEVEFGDGVFINPHGVTTDTRVWATETMSALRFTSSSSPWNLFPIVMGVELSWTLERVSKHLKYYYEYEPTAWYFGTTKIIDNGADDWQKVLADLGIKDGDTISDVAVQPPPTPPTPPPAPLCWKTKTEAAKIRAAPCGTETGAAIPPLTFVRGSGASLNAPGPCALAEGQWHKVKYYDFDGYVSETLVESAVCEGSDTPLIPPANPAPTPSNPTPAPPVTPSASGGTKCKKTKGTLARIRASPCGKEIQTVVPNADTVLVIAGVDQTKENCNDASGGQLWHHVFYAGRPGWIAGSVVDEVDCECYKTGTGVVLMRDDACGNPLSPAVPAGTYLVKMGDEKTVTTCAASATSLTWANVAYSDKVGYVATPVATLGNCN